MSQRNSGYERKDRDLYETPEWVTEALLPHIPYLRKGSIWEPAAGSEKMALVLHGYTVMSSDIEPRSSLVTQIDFLEADWWPWREPDEASGERPAIITNPPYEFATEFCEQALRLMSRWSGVVAMLLRTDFDHAKTRSHLFRDCPAFAKKLVLTKRIVWFEPDSGAKGKSPSFNHAWFIWDWKHDGPPTIGYGP